MTDNEFLERLGANVVAIREKKAMSQIELARRLERGNNQIRRIEKGLVSSNILTLKRIAEALDVPLSKLLA